MDRKDPNFIQDASPNSTGYRLLKPTTIVQLDQLRRTLQIIVAALLMGVATFGGYVLVKGDDPWTFFGPERQNIMLGMAVFCAAASVVVPMLLPRATPGDSPAMQALLTGDPDHDRAIHEAQRIQVTTIVGCALLEGGAFANLFAFMNSSDLVHALVVVLLMVGMLLRFPTRSKYLRRVDHAVETARLDQPLSK